jgi:CHAT domain-containing protein
LTSNPEAVERETIAPDGTVTREGTWLRTEAEVRGVQQALRGSKYRDLVEVTPRPAASAQDLLDAINDIRPHVVHFSGHGWSDGLVMDNGSVDTPKGQELDFELLAKLLAATTTPPTLLVLNACETLGGADLLLPAVPVVVAMSDTIADVAASVFASQFYAAIASAQTVGVALAQAKVAMEIAQLDDAELPEAIARDDVDIDDLVLVRPPS